MRYSIPPEILMTFCVRNLYEESRNYAIKYDHL